VESAPASELVQGCVDCILHTPCSAVVVVCVVLSCCGVVVVWSCCVLCVSLVATLPVYRSRSVGCASRVVDPFWEQVEEIHDGDICVSREVELVDGGQDVESTPASELVQGCVDCILHTPGSAVVVVCVVLYCCGVVVVVVWLCRVFVSFSLLRRPCIGLGRSGARLGWLVHSGNRLRKSMMAMFAFLGRLSMSTAFRM
jgi:hypothetical protein